MNRLLLIKAHLYLAGISLVFMSFMSLSGAMHLLLGDETETVDIVKHLNLPNNSIDKDGLTAMFKKELVNIVPDYKYEYIKGSSLNQMTRPTSQIYYSIKVSVDKVTILKHTPSLLKRLMEFHKGHGPRKSRLVLGILGIIVILAVISGFWLGFTSKKLRVPTLITLTSGAFLYFVSYFI